MKLNNIYKAALALHQRFSTSDGKIFIYAEGTKSLLKRQLFVEPQPHKLTCCGITELNFQTLNRIAPQMKELGDVSFRELIACFIEASVTTRDKRIVLVGIPTKVGINSLYNLEFYERLRLVLVEFGFKEICKPYTNAGSHNTIVVLTSQMP